MASVIALGFFICAGSRDGDQYHDSHGNDST